MSHTTAITHLNNLTNEELLLFVTNKPDATATEIELALRLELALDELNDIPSPQPYKTITEQREEAWREHQKVLSKPQ